MILPLALLLSLLCGAIAQDYHNDFMSFVTLPEVLALKFDIKHHDRQRLSPGYWFVAPYGKRLPREPNGRHPFHIGPYIYDQDGTLIWAGSAMFDNLNVYDFKAVHSADENQHFSLIVQKGNEPFRGRAIIMNRGFEIISDMNGPEAYGGFDIHEFTISPSGRAALVCLHWPKEMDLGYLGRPDEKSFFVTTGFLDFDLATGEANWWDSSEPGLVGLNESVILPDDLAPEESPGHDYAHLNSIDKNSDGHYLLSMRFTDTIYLVSGVDGTIIWRLGGKQSNFDQDFTFSRQHDAKFLESNGTHHVISFLNNASDDQEHTERVSSALIVALDTTTSPKTARVIRRYNRPDGDLSRLRGNVQILPGGNAFVCWSDSGYISEFSEDGDNLLEAKFLTSQFYNYRAYKFEFTGRPSEPPALVASATESEDGGLKTNIYVSWNGATDIASWQFYAQKGENNPSFPIGSVNKTNFETVYIADGHIEWVFAEAFDDAGVMLARSQVYHTTKYAQPKLFNNPWTFSSISWNLTLWGACLGLFYWLVIRLRPGIYNYISRRLSTRHADETELF
ncbi:ASST-domain-containing protein [Penicillium angulare]|uniref:ASST-domain-containing protein n=1 Tax=Penicillium angulare TaxID=116970 RepID=A0A9W9KJ73_9EURO|nr:ASST-domain-containing protein [Penicillium angulare]